MEKNFEFRDKMQKRTKAFVLRVIKLCQSLPNSSESNTIGRQLLRFQQLQLEQIIELRVERVRQKNFIVKSVLLSKKLTSLCFG